MSTPSEHEDRRLVCRRPADPLTEEALFQPAFLDRFCAELSRRLSPHVCSLSEAERVYVRSATSRQALLATTVGIVVITAGASFILAMISLGVRLWSRAGAAP